MSSVEQASNWLRRIRAVAFDMDGLMVNTETLYTQVGQSLLQRRGAQFTAALKNRMMGLPAAQAFQIMIDTAGLTSTVDELARESDEIFRLILAEQLEVLPGLQELLDLLDELGLPRCVATSSTPIFAAEVLKLTGLERRVDFVITASDVLQGKPAPDIYLAAASRMRVAVSEMLVLEDSHHGTRAGIRSGACTVAVPGEHSLSHDFAGVHFVADSLADARIKQLLADDRT